MEKITVEISYTGNNFSAYVPELLGCVSAGNTPAEVRNNIKEAIEFHIDGSLASGEYIPCKFKGEFELIYKFDTTSLLAYYKGILTNTALERLTGINQKQIAHYASRHRTPRPAQRQKIKEGLHKLGRELLSIDL